MNNNNKKILKYILILIVLFFIGKSFYTNFDNISNFDYSINYYYLSLATLFLIYANIFPVFVWRFLIHKLGGKLSPKQAMRIWFLANTGRYLPGKIWSQAGIVLLGEKEGVKKSISVQSLIYSQFYSILVGLFIVMVVFKNYLKDSGFLDIPNSSLYIIILIISIIVFNPKILNFILNFLLVKFLKREKLGNSDNNLLKRKDIILFVILQLINWINIGFTFYLFTVAFTGSWNLIIDSPEFIFIFPAAWTLGLIAIFTPGGIGVREGVLILFLTSILGPELALVLPWINRIWVTAIEFLFAVIFYFKK